MGFALASFSATMIGLPSTNSSSLVASCCAIDIATLVFLLAVSDVLSKGDDQSERKAAVLRIVCIPLIVVFFAFFALVVKQFA
jgi:hypothetical protein